MMVVAGGDVVVMDSDDDCGYLNSSQLPQVPGHRRKASKMQSETHPQCFSEAHRMH